MAVYTKLSEVEIKKILDGYDLGTFISYRGIKDGIENTNYLIVTNKKKLILTVFENRVKNSNLPFFLKLMNHSKKFGVKCPEPLKDKSKNFINIINSKSYSIFSFLEGNSKKRWSGEACYKVGRALANFHKINKNLKIKIKNDFSISFWEKLFLIIKKKKTFNTDFIRNELSYIKKKWPNKLPSGIIHADLFPDNVFFKKNDISGILDFYFSCFDFLIYDLAIVVNAWCFSSGVFQKNKYYKLISGYESIRKLKTSEIKSFNIILRGASLRFFLTRAIDSSVNKKENILVKKKDPEEFYKILKFHKSKENDFKYQ